MGTESVADGVAAAGGAAAEGAAVCACVQLTAATVSQSVTAAAREQREESA